MWLVGWTSRTLPYSQAHNNQINFTLPLCARTLFRNTMSKRKVAPGSMQALRGLIRAQKNHLLTPARKEGHLKGRLKFAMVERKAAKEGFLKRRLKCAMVERKG